MMRINASTLIVTDDLSTTNLRVRMMKANYSSSSMAGVCDVGFVPQAMEFLSAFFIHTFESVRSCYIEKILGNQRLEELVAQRNRQALSDNYRRSRVAPAPGSRAAAHGGTGRSRPVKHPSPHNPCLARWRGSRRGAKTANF